MKQRDSFKESYQRINYLYQAAHLCLQQSPPNPEQCRFYIQTLKTVAEKHVIRLHPEIKRSICRKCYMLLVPGITSSCKIKKKGEKQTAVSCLHCGSVKHFPWKKNYQLWVEKPEAFQPS
ncbi:ribonuclease P protein subunit p21-like [Babylonia areolata]|uniref:ribonuclease P protein subunit p21-like n=1 Tax=Babylonia areolata TaxID=304850 RepID=UPI003FD0F04E